jgi:hypothetical protein
VDDVEDVDLRAGGRASSKDSVRCESDSFGFPLPCRDGDAPKDPPGDIVPGESVMSVFSLDPSGLWDFSRSRFLLCPSIPAPKVSGILSNKGYYLSVILLPT